ncbi:MAG: DNA mismatch repair endonuclease MutL [Pirellulales bacterium]
MPRIVQLSTSVVNKIAAGEVIERPASVVKELMENSVDAGAVRIDVTLGQGGGELIRVVDDGCGIDVEDLPLAVDSHATSKIRSAEDLFSVRTLGFRGEALASIAEVSRFSLRSRTAEQSSGAELEVAGGARGQVAPCGCPIGTRIEVRDLFFNTPVRRKFLRTTQTEMGHAGEAFARIALANPHIHFTLTHNTRCIHDLPPTERWLERIAAFFGPELAREMISVESTDENITLSGYVANPAHSRTNNRMQYLFLNGRFIRDRSLQHALGEAYRGLLMTGRYPISCLRLEIPAETVDVNVHPTKLEVRFQDAGRLYSQLLGTLRTRFLSTDLTAHVGGSGGEQHEAAHDAAAAEAIRRDVVGWAKSELAERIDESQRQFQRQSTQGTLVAAESIEAQRAAAARYDGPLSLNYLNRAATKPRPEWLDDEDDDEDHAKPAQGQALPAPAGDETTPSLPATIRRVDRGGGAMQVLNRYVIAEEGDGVVVIDQHALHERILYEQIRDKVLAGALESQRLLVPEPVDLSSEEAAAVLASGEVLAKLGITVEPFGGGTILISSYPAMLANMPPGELVRELVDRLLSGGKTPDRRDVLDELMHMMSCKAAVKAGDRLTPVEVSALLDQRLLAQDAHHCPHGRPTALVFTREELDKQFKRT